MEAMGQPGATEPGMPDPAEPTPVDPPATAEPAPQEEAEQPYVNDQQKAENERNEAASEDPVADDFRLVASMARAEGSIGALRVANLLDGAAGELDEREADETTSDGESGDITGE